MKQMAVVSGKGGTGKTSIVASLAALASGRAVFADCDVDAPDLHLLLSPRVVAKRPFYGIKRAFIDAERCTQCGSCQEACRFSAIAGFQVASDRCEGCGVCKLVCPSDAVQMREALAGHAFISDSRFGPMVHAELFAGEEASGKLVAMVREMAREVAVARNRDLVLIDGSPGIGCPVIASLTGVDLALVVTEPTITGEHDLERILDVAGHFGIDTIVCINKYDLHLAGSKRIESLCQEREVLVAGKLPFHSSVVEAMVLGKTVVENGGQVAIAISNMWDVLSEKL
ncbi:MAG: electron transport complex protein RnfB [Methanosaeta sp. PtaU1.Bin112]|nr:MAG: electron transport complex protein RnfB [Methanosaeta sp. PtaU1.Bin112]